MKKLLAFALMILALGLSGCVKNEPEINKAAAATQSGNFQLKHSVYIPAHNDSTKGTTGALIEDIDNWIDKNQDKEVLTVVMVNATQEDMMGGYSHTTISGALVIFKAK